MMYIYFNRDERLPKSPVTEFTKFEEKKRQQTDKRKTLLKLNVFKKSTNAKGIVISIFHRHILVTCCKQTK